MKLSTRTRYGTRFLLALAREYGKGPVLLKDIANREWISEKYLGQIVLALKGVGLIDAHRGARGGYFLTRPPGEITLMDVFEAFEKPFQLVDCHQGGKICSRFSLCVVREVWEELTRRLSDSLKGITLLDLCEREKKKAIPFTYTI